MQSLLSVTQASIILLLKKDKGPTSCSSYRPLSLKNVDAKIVGKVLAQWRRTVRAVRGNLTPLISSGALRLTLETAVFILLVRRIQLEGLQEQTGFIKGRQLFFYYICTLSNIIYSKHSSVVPGGGNCSRCIKSIWSSWVAFLLFLKNVGLGMLGFYGCLLYANPRRQLCTH